MRLRGKLILVALVILVLPWSAWRYLRETEGFLREGQGRALEATATVVARVLEQHYRLQPWRDGGLYLRAAAHPPLIDGYADDWEPWLPFAHRLADWAELALAEDDAALYLLLRVQDFGIVYARGEGAPAERGDHVLLSLGDGASEQLYLIGTEAPGWVRAEPLGGLAAPAIQGEWQEGPNGYLLELRIPKTTDWQTLGLTVVDARPDPAQSRQAGTGGVIPAVALPLVRPQQTALLEGLAPADGRLWLVDAEGWVLGRSGTLAAERPSESRWLHDLSYRLLVAPPLDEPYRRTAEDLRLDGVEVRTALAGMAASRWQPAEATVVATAAVPVRVDGKVVGAVVAEQASDALQLLTHQAALRLLGGTSLAFAGALAVLLLFASRLSLRIRRLRDAAAAAVAPEGDGGEFPLRRDADELGDLARAFEGTLATLRGYTDYLRTLAAKLSHELRTPLAVVSSSLDNLGQTPLPTEAAPYLERARQGAERLSRLLRAMSEADRLERAIEREEGEWLDLRELVEALLEPYRELAAGRALSLDVEPAVYRLYGSPDLIVQLLDKLIDNAIGFTPAGGWIRLRLRRRGDALELAMANQGPPLPAQMRERLFDSLVSVRAERDQQPHLGLGLYIVRLIAELHRGYARAADLPHGEGVEFTVGLRGMPLPASSR